MGVWWRRLSRVSDIETSRFIREHGEQAYELATQAARTARNQRDQKKARHYTILALQIAEITGRQIEPHAAKRMSKRQAALIGPLGNHGHQSS